MHFEAPSPDPRSEGFEQWEIDAAQAVVASFLAARGPFRTLSFEDLLQEGLLAWWQQRDRYSPARGATRTFLGKVITSRLLDLRRADLADKRTADRLAESFDREDSAADETLYDVVQDVQAPDPALEAEGRELTEGLKRARQRLSPRERAVLEGMLVEKSVAELSRELGTSRVTVHADRVRIREALAAEGLRDFLG